MIQSIEEFVREHMHKENICFDVCKVNKDVFVHATQFRVAPQRIATLHIATMSQDNFLQLGAQLELINEALRNIEIICEAAVFQKLGNR